MSEQNDKLIKYGIITLVVVAVLVSLISLLPEREYVPQGTQGIIQQPTMDVTAPIEININDYPSIGDENSPVTILEFYDYQCGFCQRHYFETDPLIKQQYVDQGKVRVVLMDFISVGTHRPHEAAKCVLELEGKQAFLTMHNSIFENARGITDATLTTLAVQAGASESEFVACLNSGKYRQMIDTSTAYGRSLGISGTPGFTINGQVVSGAQPFQVFQQAIEANL